MWSIARHFNRLRRNASLISSCFLLDRYFYRIGENKEICNSHVIGIVNNSKDLRVFLALLLDMIFFEEIYISIN